MKKCDGCSFCQEPPEERVEQKIQKIVDYDPRTEFVRRLEHVINSFSIENESNTPDFILAQFLRSVLDAWNEATKERERWYGKELKI